MVFQQPEMQLYQRLVEAARNRLADLELESGFEKSKVDAIRSKLFGPLPTYYQERDSLRVLVNFRKVFIERLPPSSAPTWDAARRTKPPFASSGTAPPPLPQISTSCSRPNTAWPKCSPPTPTAQPGTRMAEPSHRRRTPRRRPRTPYSCEYGVTSCLGSGRAGLVVSA